MATTRARAVTFEFSTPEIALDDEGFGLHVVDFDGLEVIQRPFRFELNLASRDPEIDFARVVNGPGKLEIVRHDIAGAEYHRSTVHGLVTDFQQGGKDGDQVMYRATLRPRLWALSLTRRSRIFSNRSVPEILRELMDEHEVPYEISLKATYPAHETVVQHHETDLAFFTRLATKDGIRFTFQHDDAHDTVVLSDAPGQDPWIPGDPEVLYKSHDGLVADKDTEETVVDAFLRERTVPGKVNLQDYNHRTPSAGMDTEDDKSDGKDKRGHHQVFGQHYKDASDGKRLARVRREALHALARSITARTVCTRLRAGHRFTLAGHYRKSLDGDYLVACVRHRGGQSQDVGTVGEGGTEGQDYENRVGMLPAAVPYRPPARGELEVVFPDVFVDASVHLSASATISASLSTTIDFDTTFETHEHHHHGAGGKMFGLMTATIGGGGGYAAVDGDGKYVLQPKFPEGGGATHSARQIQPYAGGAAGRGEAGFHFATEAGNEVIYACLDGDPDRPIILGPVPNPEHASPVTSGNSSQHIIRTTHDNELLIDDKDGAELIRLFTPRATSSLTLGQEGAQAGVSLRTDQNAVLQAKNNTFVQGGGGVVLTTWDGTSDGTTQVISVATPVVTALLGVAQMAYTKDGLSFDTLFQQISSANEIAQWAITAANMVGDVGPSFGMSQGMADNAKFFATPGILATARGGIDMVTAAGFNVLAAAGITMFTPLGAGISALAGINLVAGKDIGMFTGEGDWQATAGTGKAGIRALKEILFISENDKMDLEAMETITLKSYTKDIILRSEARNIQFAAKKGMSIVAEDDQFFMEAKKKSVITKAKQMVGLDAGDQVVAEAGRANLVLDKSGKVTIKAGLSELEMSNSGIELKIGQSKIKLTPSGIEMKGPQFKAEGQATAEVKGGAMLTLQASGMAKLKGGVVMIN